MSRAFHLTGTCGALLALAGCTTIRSYPDACATTDVRDDVHSFSKPVRSWQRIRTDNVVMQQADYTCGAAALATLIRYFWGDKITEVDILASIMTRLSAEELTDRSTNGLSMTDLRRAAVDHGYLAVIGRRTMPQLLEVKVPVILRIRHREHEHFVVLRGFREGRAFLADPIRGNVRLPIEELACEWTDEAVLVVVKPGVQPPTCHALSVYKPVPVQHELQAAHRALQLAPIVGDHPPLPGIR
jgi:predicted double-glycine peptidase